MGYSTLSEGVLKLPCLTSARSISSQGAHVPKYHVIIESKATASQPLRVKTVEYETEDYSVAWVGARTVCRLGTLFRDDPRCRNPSMAREFFDLEGDRFPIAPGAWVVRRIFVDGTRKTGKQRMTNLTAEQLLTALQTSDVALTPEARAKIEALLASGLRITCAMARTLGIDTPNVTPPRPRKREGQ